jgi:hypothetical protein
LSQTGLSPAKAIENLRLEAAKFMLEQGQLPVEEKVADPELLLSRVGVREGLAPITLGDVARISMILDPDGNWIELSRRASIVGSLS